MTSKNAFTKNILYINDSLKNYLNNLYPKKIQDNMNFNIF